ncbi:MAG: tetratricopeptide repeat protein, partial [Actinomycetota bacterium]|nr:tetratricopeptide repeat protein [Actinomycetota bacterium]
MTRHLIGGVAALTLLAAAPTAWAAPKDCFTDAKDEAGYLSMEAGCARMAAEATDDLTKKRANVGRAYALFFLQRYEDSLKASDGALALDPKDSDALLVRARTLRLLNRTDEALAAATLAVEADAEDAYAWSLRGQIWHGGKDDPVKARADYDKAIALDPKNGLTYYHRSELTDDAAVALLDLDKAAALEPGDADIHAARANALRDLGRPKEALAEYDTALRLDPSYQAALISRVYAKLDLGDVKGAARDADRAVALDPGSAYAVAVQGYVLEAEERLEEAAARYETASKLAPKDASLRLGVARVRRSLGQYDQALAALDTAEALDAK